MWIVSNVIEFLRKTFKDRTENPFFEEPSKPLTGTFLIVWTLHHWELIFSLFNFDDGTRLNGKVEFVKKYLNSNGFVGMVLCPLFYTICALVTFYICMNIGIAISSYFDFNVKPKILKNIAGKSQIVGIEKYNNLKNRIRPLEEQIDELTEQNNKAESEVSKIKGKLAASSDSMNNMKSEISRIVRVFNPYIINSDSNVSYFDNYKMLQAEYHIHGFDKNKFHPNWIIAMNKFPQLRNANWLSHQYKLSSEEEIRGGVYEFQLSFEIPLPKSNLSSATLYCLVDDYGSFNLNGNQLYNTVGKSEVEFFENLHVIDLLPYIATKNFLKIKIRNAPANIIAIDKFYDEGGEQGLANPCGIIFSMHFSYKPELDDIPITVIEE